MAYPLCNIVGKYSRLGCAEKWKSPLELPAPGLPTWCSFLWYVCFLFLYDVVALFVWLLTICGCHCGLFTSGMGVARAGGRGGLKLCATCCCIFKDVVDMLPQSTKVAGSPTTMTWATISTERISRRISLSSPSVCVRVWRTCATVRVCVCARADAINCCLLQLRKCVPEAVWEGQKLRAEVFVLRLITENRDFMSHLKSRKKAEEAARETNARKRIQYNSLIVCIFPLSASYEIGRG